MAARPLAVPVAELRRRAGSRRPLQRAVEVSTFGELQGVAGTTVPAGGEIELDLVVESVLEGVTVTGSLRAPWRADCRRCLEPVDGVVDVDVQELFEAHPTVGETYPLDGDQIDLSPLIRDAVLLALPLSALCDDACAGPDPERFPAAVEDDIAPSRGTGGGGGVGAAGGEDDAAPADDPPADPRWAALRQLRFEE